MSVNTQGVKKVSEEETVSAGKPTRHLRPTAA